MLKSFLKRPSPKGCGDDTSLCVGTEVWIPRIHVKDRWCGGQPVMPAPRKRTQGIPKASWLAKLAASMSSRFCKRRYLSKQRAIKGDARHHLWLPHTSFYVYIHTHAQEPYSCDAL